MGQYPGGGGSLAPYPKNKRRAMLALSVVHCEGVLKNVAFDLGYSRRQIYRLIVEHRLWPIVNRARIKRLEDAARARRRSDGI